MTARSTEPIDTPYPHGTDSCYRMGCGCVACKEAHTDAAWEAKQRQLVMFPETGGQRPAPIRRPVIPDIPLGLDLAVVAERVADPDPRWTERARCANQPGLCDTFHVEVIVQHRRDGTQGWCKPGDLVPAAYQDWCAACPVRPDCVADALRHEAANYRTGFYGSTPTQRGHIAHALRALKAAS